jgi:Iap family predicted aminopeptidase
MDKAKLEREKFEKQIAEINEKIDKEDERMRNSLEYKSLDKKRRDLWNTIDIKKNELKALRRAVSQKYVKGYDYRGLRLDTKNIKSSVKAGVKRGLGLKSVSCIDERDMEKVVRKLIEDELKQTSENEMVLVIENLNKEAQVIERDINKLNKGVILLQEEKQKIYTEQNKDEMNRIKIRKIKIAESKKIIETKLPELITKIKQEVTKGLIQDNLEKQ